MASMCRTTALPGNTQQTAAELVALIATTELFWRGSILGAIAHLSDALIRGAHAAAVCVPGAEFSLMQGASAEVWAHWDGILR